MRSLFLALALLSPSLACAASAAAPESITVTAHRTPQPLARTGSAVSIIDRGHIETHQSAVAAEALRSVPGLTIARSGPLGAQTQIRLRGAEANHLLVLIDGVETNDLATDGAFSFEHLTTFDIERIEVVRGPQSALWGSDALAGVINVVTRRPRAPLEVSGFAEGGSWGFANGGARLGLRGDAGWLSASVSRLDTEGTNAARAGEEDDGYDNTTWNFAGRVRLSPLLAFEASVRNTDVTAEFDGNDFVDGVLVAVDAGNETDLRQNFARAGFELASPGGRLMQQLHYAVAETDAETMSEDPFGGGLTRAATNGKRYGAYYQASLRLRDDGAGPADQLTLALDHEREEFSQRAAATAFGDPNQDQQLRSTGYAFEYVAYLAPALALSASARHDDNSDFGDVNTWRTTLSWTLPGAATRLHGSFGTGQKSPTFFERFGYTPDTFVGNPDLEPETSKGWDAGVERHWFEGRLVTDLTYFRADLEDEINGFFCPPPSPPDFEPLPCTAINESGESERKGIEASLDLALSSAWTLSATYTYTDASQSDPQLDGSDPGIVEVRRPRHAGSLGLTRRSGRLTLNAAAHYTGARQDDTFLLDAPFVRRARLGDYTLAEIAVSYELSPGVTLYGRLENAFDENYEDVFGYATPGRSGFAGVRVDFARRR